MAIATIRLKLTSTAARLIAVLRAVPRSCAVAIWRHAGPPPGSRSKTARASAGATRTAPMRRHAIAR